MAKSVLSAKHFQDEAAAFAYVEASLWPNGPVCPHCGEAVRVGRMNGKTTRVGLCKCYACKKPFTVRMGSIFQSSHLALHLWLQVIHLMCASKKGISTHQIQRMLNCSMKTAWFLGHRIRLAMKDDVMGPLGGEGKIVEADETFIGQREGTTWQEKRGGRHKIAVLALVERNGKARSFQIGVATKKNIQGHVHANVDRKTHLMTDEASHYSRDLRMKHSTVNHGEKEYARGIVSTNTVEGFFSVFKRGMIGTYQVCSEKHLHRYLSEFDFRYNEREALGVNDVSRAEAALKGTKGKRLTYQTTRGGQAEA